MRTFAFIVLIPAIVAIGHDVYLFITQTGIENYDGISGGDKPWHSHFAALGWIWTNYHPDSYRWVSQNIDPSQWTFISALLGQKAVVVSLCFGAVLYTIARVFHALKTRPLKSETSAGAAQKRFKYKRK